MPSGRDHLDRKNAPENIAPLVFHERKVHRASTPGEHRYDECFSSQDVPGRAFTESDGGSIRYDPYETSRNVKR